MPYSTEEEANIDTVKQALDHASQDFTRFFKEIFDKDVEWVIAGHGSVARTYYGLDDLFENAEKALFARLSQPLSIITRGVWADSDKIFAQIDSSSVAVDGNPYRNGYMYLMTLRDNKVISGIEWLDLNAYYEIVARVKLGD